MSTDVFAIHGDALEGARLAGFRGTERLGRPFEFDIFFTIPTGTDVKSAVGSRATLTADRDDGRGPMRWHGIFAALRLLHETAERSLYRGLLVPRLWLLAHHVRSFVHTKKKLDAFAADTLQDAGLTTADFAFHIHSGSYPDEEFVCQYRESHLDFLHRWFEREGLYYYFEHEDSDSGTEKLIIVDDKSHHAPLLGKGLLRYAPSAGPDTSAGECLRELSADFALLPKSVLVSDYNYANPSAPVAGEKAISGIGQGKIREYGYRVFTESEATRLAAVKAQSLACRELTLTATGDALGLRAGYSFEVEDAPADLPAKYLAIEVRHAGAVSGSAALVKRYTGLDPAETYRVDVVAIPKDTQFRTAQSTAWPRIYGFENGTVDGPGESQYAQIDDQGRYLVRFKFDTSDLPDGSTSTYLRMMQPHGGTTEGWHFPLRKGTEVMVSFQGGDPDRPVIAGVVPNAVQPSNVTSANYTQNVLRTGGDNYLVMDDIDGAQTIEMSTPVDATSYVMGGPSELNLGVPPWNPDYADERKTFRFGYHLKTDGDAGFVVGGEWYQWIGASHWLDVAKEGRTRFGGRYTLIIGGISNEYYGGTRNTIVTSGRTDKVKSGGFNQEIVGGYSQTVTGNGSQHATGAWEHKVTGENHDDYGSWRSTIKGAWTAEAKGSVSIASKSATVTIESPAEIALNAPTVSFRGAKVQTQSSDFIDMFATQHSVGIEKFDGAAVATSITTGLKLEHTSASIGMTAVKIEKVGYRAVNDGAALEGTPLKIAQGAFRLASFGFLKL
ncbi:MAG: type VI secretion system tip protein TssI/VgrG [Polyangiaceae bacterium]